MLGSTVLELALGLCVFYIALSLVCSGVTQYLSEWRERRGRILVGILSELVNHAAHDGESILTGLLADARIAGGPPGTKPKETTAPDKKALVLPAGGRIDESVFTDVLLDLVAGKVIKTTGAAAPAVVDGAAAGQAPSDPTGQLVERLLAAVKSLQSGITISLSGPDLAKWDTLLKELQPQIDALKGLPLDDVSRRAEAILKALQVAATAEGQAEIRTRLLEVVAQETDAVLGLARRLTTAKALDLVARDMPESPFRSFLSRLASRGALEPDEVKDAIQDWYSRVNDRVSVEYRAKTKVYLFVTGLLVTLLLNADTFQIANRLVKDETLRKFVAQDAVAAGGDLEYGLGRGGSGEGGGRVSAGEFLVNPRPGRREVVRERGPLRRAGPVEHPPEVDAGRLGEPQRSRPLLAAPEGLRRPVQDPRSGDHGPGAHHGRGVLVQPPEAARAGPARPESEVLVGLNAPLVRAVSTSRPRSPRRKARKGDLGL